MQLDQSDSSAIAVSLGVSASCDSFCHSQCCRHADCVMEFFSGVSSNFFMVPNLVDNVTTYYEKE
jgi:hypothetical protein